MARARRRWHHLGGRVRSVHGDAYLVGKGRWQAAAVSWDSNPPSRCTTPRGPGREDVVTCGFFVPVLTARAHRNPAVSDAVWTHHGPSHAVTP